MPLTKEQKKDQKNNLMHVKLAKGTTPTVVTAKSTTRAVIGSPPEDEFDAAELREDVEAIDPDNPPCCDGCLKALPKGMEDKSLRVYYKFDNYTIYVCHKCWKEMKVADRIELSRKMQEDTQYKYNK